MEALRQRFVAEGAVAEGAGGGVRGTGGCWICGTLLSVVAHAAVRIPSTLLEPAVLLLLGASTVFGCSVAQALVFNWSISGRYDLIDPDLEITTPRAGDSYAGSGTITTSDSSVTLNNVNNLYLINGMTGQWSTNGSASELTFVGAGYLRFVSGSTTTLSSFGDINFTTAAGDDIYMYRFTGTGDVDTVYNNNGGNSNKESASGVSDNTLSAEASVPAPLPILGLPAVLFYSRRLKKRIKERNSTVVVG